MKSPQDRGVFSQCLTLGPRAEDPGRYGIWGVVHWTPLSLDSKVPCVYRGCQRLDREEDRTRPTPQGRRTTEHCCLRLKETCWSYGFLVVIKNKNK